MTALSSMLENLFAYLQVLPDCIIIIFIFNLYLLVFLINNLPWPTYLKSYSLRSYRKRHYYTSLPDVIIGKAIFIKYSIFYYSHLFSESWLVDWANK